MSIVYSADLFCDSCLLWEHGITQRDYPPTKTSARQANYEREPGWTYAQGLDFCPVCSANRVILEDSDDS